MGSTTLLAVNPDSVVCVNCHRGGTGGGKANATVRSNMTKRRDGSVGGGGGGGDGGGNEVESGATAVSCDKDTLPLQPLPVSLGLGLGRPMLWSMRWIESNTLSIKMPHRSSVMLFWTKSIGRISSSSSSCCFSYCCCVRAPPNVRVALVEGCEEEDRRRLFLCLYSLCFLFFLRRCFSLCFSCKLSLDWPCE